MELSVRVEFSRKEAASSVLVSYRYHLLSVLCSSTMDMNVKWLAERCVTFLAYNSAALSLCLLHASGRISVAPSK